MQTDATCWAQQCCVLLANNAASVCMGVKGSLAAWTTSAKTTAVGNRLSFSFSLCILHVFLIAFRVQEYE